MVDPAAGVRLTTQTLGTVQAGASGARATNSIEARDVSGSFAVVSFDTEKSDNVHAIDVDLTPQNVEPTPQNKAK